MVCTGSIAAQRMLEAVGYETLAQPQPHFACFVDDFLLAQPESQRFHFSCFHGDFLLPNHGSIFIFVVLILFGTTTVTQFKF